MLTEFDSKCLRAISDGYIEIAGIQEMLKASGIETSAREISLCLHTLIRLKLAQAYECDDSTYTYTVLEFTIERAQLPNALHTWRPGETTTSRLWFYVTRSGKDLVIEWNKGQAGG
jgi:hypothetical protein